MVIVQNAKLEALRPLLVAEHHLLTGEGSSVLLSPSSTPSLSLSLKFPLLSVFQLEQKCHLHHLPTYQLQGCCSLKNLSAPLTVSFQCPTFYLAKVFSGSGSEDMGGGGHGMGYLMGRAEKKNTN